jgi:hypothetical protein
MSNNNINIQQYKNFYLFLHLQNGCDENSSSTENSDEHGGHSLFSGKKINQGEKIKTQPALGV